ncbi:MAG TPA: pseudouridine synthase [Gammaproteobacteria bacterium]|jgi:23S rRNA pseudouridine2605 synthase|nr:pseudouridine synthase [Gammaproteobacteria bacterium]
MSDKIQKILANAGLGSRRQIEEMIKAGRVMVNGKLAHIGERMTTRDVVLVDQRKIELVKSINQKTRVLLYHKPEGEMCTRNDPEGRPTIFESLPLIRNSRWICVGRLDFNTSGLLLITNDGDLANQLMHPSSTIEREYAVRVRGEVTAEIEKTLQKGVMLEDGLAKFDTLTEAGGTGSNHWYHVVVKEGRNRLVRRLWESQDLTVSRLIRIRFGNVYLPSGLKRGRHVELTENEINLLTQFIEQLNEHNARTDEIKEEHLEAKTKISLRKKTNPIEGKKKNGTQRRARKSQDD